MYDPSCLYAYAEESFPGVVSHLENGITAGEWLCFRGPGTEAPTVLLRFEDEWATAGVALESPEALARLRNVLNAKARPVAEELVGLLRGLDPRFKTKLQRRSESNGTLSYSDVKSYISQKVDAYLLSLVLVEAEAVRQDGLRARGGARVSASLSLAQVSVAPDPAAFSTRLRALVPILDLASSLRSRAAAPVVKVDKVKQEADSYRAFVLMLNDARRRGLISAEERRRMDERWRREPDSGRVLAEELERLLTG